MSNNEKIIELHVKKRDGRIIPFNDAEIKTAIKKAAKEVPDSSITDKDLTQIVDYVLKDIPSITTTIDVEQVHERVIEALYNMGYTHIAHTYQSYYTKRKALYAKYKKEIETLPLKPIDISPEQNNHYMMDILARVTKYERHAPIIPEIVLYYILHEYEITNDTVGMTYILSRYPLLVSLIKER